MVGVEIANKKAKKKLKEKRRIAKRRHLGYILLVPIKDGEIGHHITNEYVIGVPKEAHERCNSNREGHRRKVINWLKINDSEKYDLVLSILKSNTTT